MSKRKKASLIPNPKPRTVQLPLAPLLRLELDPVGVAALMAALTVLQLAMTNQATCKAVFDDHPDQELAQFASALLYRAGGNPNPATLEERTAVLTRAEGEALRAYVTLGKWLERHEAETLRSLQQEE